MDKNKITIKTSYAGMVSFVEEQSDRKAKKRALNHIYEVFKDVVDTDLDARFNIIRLRKEVDLPLRMNKAQSSNYKFHPSPTAGSRKSRRQGGNEQMALQQRREAQMEAFGLDPQDKEQLILYSEYLEIKKTLNNKQKKEIKLTMMFGGIKTKKDLEEVLITVKQS
jgi:hypothetical protein